MKSISQTLANQVPRQRSQITPTLPPLRQTKVMDQLRERIRYMRYSLRTKQAYCQWVRDFLRFHKMRHPSTMGKDEIENYLAYLANTRKVSVSTHKQALSALLFFYSNVLSHELPWLNDIGRPQSARRLPVVLTHDEIDDIFSQLDSTEYLTFAKLLYRTGLRILEAFKPNNC